MLVGQKVVQIIEDQYDSHTGGWWCLQRLAQRLDEFVVRSGSARRTTQTLVEFIQNTREQG